MQQLQPGSLMQCVQMVPAVVYGAPAAAPPLPTAMAALAAPLPPCALAALAAMPSAAAATAMDATAAPWKWQPTPEELEAILRSAMPDHYED
mmetsp:Transcript_128266/g.410137  ORF Transcript_128266/g.410137 Transcript_128266/m.410137 type:complete len:92 (-) Transcript_128266:106-381(-)